MHLADGFCLLPSAAACYLPFGPVLRRFAPPGRNPQCLLMLPRPRAAPWTLPLLPWACSIHLQALGRAQLSRSTAQRAHVASHCTSCKNSDLHFTVVLPLIRLTCEQALLRAGPAARAECCMLGTAALCLTCPAHLQALRRMLLFGFQSDARTLQQVPVVPGVVQGLLEALQALLSLRPALRQPAARTQAAIMLERGLIKMAKTLVSTQETHPWSGPPSTAPCMA